jgi:hypothetical protein
LKTPLTLCLCIVASWAFAAPNPSNLGLGLRQLVDSYKRDRAVAQAKAATSRTIQLDSQDRVVVNVHLDGKAPINVVAAVLTRAGAEILAIDPNWRHGVISARLPLAQAEAIGSAVGVQSVMLAHRPIHRIGKVTAESSVVEHALQANTAGVLSTNGFLGRNISVGIISDSYDTAQGVPRANAGVAAGDLPGIGNPDGYTQPVVNLEDNFSFSGTTDEGRGMAEIIHDIAPAAKICFHTSGISQPIMSLGIRKLRSDSNARCDIIVDDVFFFDEPFFSDGEVALAIEDVSTGASLPGKKVAYFSAAGNSGNNGYSSDLRLLSPAQGQQANNMAGANQVDLSGVDPSLFAGGFHNLKTSGTPTIAMPITTDGVIPPLVVFQWDDPFDTGTVTTDYNLLVFDSDGNYLDSLSGTDDNISTSEPIELVELDPDTKYFLVIALASAAPPTATHLRFIAVNDATLSGPQIALNAITTAGHPTAKHANGVGGYVYNLLAQINPSYNSAGLNPPPGPYRPALERFTSNGGALAFYFDASGTRLATPDIRLEPKFSAADGVDTSFFPPDTGNDADNDGFPNFFGTSAAAPTAASIAALLLEAAGGPQSLIPDQVATTLQQTTIPHDVDPFFCQAIASNASAVVRVSASGNASDDSATDHNFFALSFTGSPGQTLDQLVIDLTNTLLEFDEDPVLGLPFTIGNNPDDIMVAHSLSPNHRVLTLTFTSPLVSGNTISFGIDRDFAGLHSGGNSADLLAGADIRASINGNSVTLLGAFANALGRGFTFADGFGLVDARNAIESIVGKPTNPTGIPVNLSTRGFTGTNDNVLIGGFISSGSSAKTLILRALGPSLAAFNVVNPLSDPILGLFDANGNQIAFDDNWQTNSAQAAQIQSHHLAPSDPRESALFETLSPGSYTAIVRGKNNSTGTSLVDVYDLDSQPAATEFTNISTRGNVSSGDNVLIGGFIVGANLSADIIVRGIGPSLASASVPDPLLDPMLTLHDSNGDLIASNDNWQQDSAQAAEIQQAGLAPGNALESAIAITLAPGAYTAILSGANSTIGNGLVQIYKIHH